MRFLSLVDRELHDQVWSLRFLAITGTAAVLAVFAVRAGSLDLALRQTNTEAVLKQLAEDQARNGGRLNAVSVEPGLRAVRAPNDLSVFVRGMDPVLPAYWDFTPSHVQPGPSALSPQSAVGNGMSLDLEFLIRVVLGLLALVMGRDSLIHARDTGTLRALLSQPLRSWTILASKVTAGMMALSISLILVLAGSVIGTRIWMPGLLSQEFAQFFGVTFAVSLLYLLVLFFIGLALAATLQAGRVVVSISMVLWLYVVLLAPLLIPLIGGILAPPQEALQAQLQSTYDREFRTTQEVIGAELAASASSGTEVLNLTNIDDRTTARLEAFWGYRTNVLRGVLDAYEKEAETQTLHQRRMIRFLETLSPASQFAHGTSSLAGTGPLLEERWESAIRHRHQTVNAMVFDDRPRVSLLVPQDRGRVMFSFKRREPQLISHIARFEPPSPSLRTRIDDAKPHMAILAAYAAVLLAWTFVAFSRRPV